MRAGFVAVAGIWLALIGCGYATGAAHAQENVVCGNLYVRVTSDTSSSGNWSVFQVFRHVDSVQRAVLPHPQDTPSAPSARCVGGSVLMIAFSPASGTPSAYLVFQNGSHLVELLGDGDYEVRGNAFVIPPRPPLLQSARERIPVEYRGLFDYSGRKLYVD